MTTAIAPTPGLASGGVPLKEPGLTDVLLAFRQKLLLELNCVKIGQIQAFYPSTFSADVSIVLQRTMTDGSFASYPKLLNCPVVTPQGGGASLQFPIAPGDQCLVVFMDRNLRGWFTQGTPQPPPDTRLHDVSDAIAIVGLNYSLASNIPHPSATETRLILKDGTTKVGLEGGLITVQNASQNLGTILTNLVTTFQTLNTAIAGMTTASIAAGTTQAIAAGLEAEIVLLLADLAALLY